MYRQQRILLYVLPLVFAFSGFTFPLGVMFYWLVSNFWTMAQQFLVIRNMPTPGSEAALAREARLARRSSARHHRGVARVRRRSSSPSRSRSRQRQQPVSKNRAKKKPRKKK